MKISDYNLPGWFVALLIISESSAHFPRLFRKTVSFLKEGGGFYLVAKSQSKETDPLKSLAK
jgi:hypothetical protein